MRYLLFLISTFAFSQAIQIDRVTSDPPGGACNARANWRWNQMNDKVWACDGTSWKLVGTAGVTPGTVTSVSFSTNLGTVGGSPITTAGTITDTITAAQVVSLFSTCSGVQYLGADGACHNSGAGTVTHTGNLTANQPVFGNGVADITIGTKSGNTTEVMSATGSYTSGHCLNTDANGNATDAGFACNTGTGGLTSGAAFTPINNTSGSSVNWQDGTILAKIPGLSLYAYPSSWKVRMLFTAGSPVIGAMKILSTLTNSLTVTASTTVQIGGVSNPTLTTPTLVNTDAISLATDDLHDYWFAIYFTNTGANSTVGVMSKNGATPAGTQAIVNLVTGWTNGDSTGVATIPALSGPNSPYLVVSGILP